MAMSSSLSMLSYQDTSDPYSAADSMSLEIESTPVNIRSSLGSDKHPDPGNIDVPDSATSVSNQSAATKTKTVGENESTPSATPAHRSGSPSTSGLTIQTSHVNGTASTTRSDEDEPPQSVIHVPPGFGEFTKTQEADEDGCDDEDSPLSTSASHSMVLTVHEKSKKNDISPISPPPLTTTVPPSKDWSERATPRAQTRYGFEESDRHTRTSSLEDIPEAVGLSGKEAEINALRTALAECWTLCNTLASLSYINRERLLKTHEDGMQEDAWKSCWRLCQKLYDTRDEDFASQVNPTLDLCRDFCQALFEVRVCDSDLTDSVLRVSFELNNHLYNTHDRNLPDAFRERTLDFYITLCHRLMKQRTRLNATDSLLSACWTLAEMLFSIRQSKREGRKLDEELLGSAVQACWELCDIFREGWTLHSLRNSDRGTPRPSQTTFAQAFQQATQRSGIDFETDSSVQPGNPETPTTIFEDMATVSPEEAPVPNILVLGHGSSHGSHSKWPSSASSISEQSRSSSHTASSANTVTTVSEDPNFTRLRVLITKAAMNSGYQRGGSHNLSSFVKSLPSDAFGSAPWQTSLLKYYRKLVGFDPAFRHVGTQARVSAIDMARACQSMVQSSQFSWLRDLYRLVFGFHMEDAIGRKGITIQT